MCLKTQTFVRRLVMTSVRRNAVAIRMKLRLLEMGALLSLSISRDLMSSIPYVNPMNNALGIPKAQTSLQHYLLLA
jgi:hypothetical protein